MDPQTVVLALGSLVPLPVALVTKRYAQPWVKVLVNMVGSVLVAALVHLATDEGGYDLPTLWRAFLQAAAASALAYAAVWKHAVVRAIESATGGWGLGTPALAVVPADPDVVVDAQGAVVPDGDPSGVPGVRQMPPLPPTTL